MKSIVNHPTRVAYQSAELVSSNDQYMSGSIFIKLKYNIRIKYLMLTIHCIINTL